jgi:uncharacterized protein Veg
MDDLHISDLKDQIETARHYGERVSVYCNKGKILFGYVADTTGSSFTITGDGTEHSLRYSDVLMFDALEAER